MRPGPASGRKLGKAKHGVIERIVWAWILTIPAAGGVVYGLFTLFEMAGWT